MADALLAGAILGDLGEPAREFGELFMYATLFGIEFARGEFKTLQSSCGARLRFAQGGQLMRGNGGSRGRRGLSFGRVDGRLIGLRQNGFSLFELRPRRDPAQIGNARLGRADLGGDMLVALRLACLPRQTFDLRIELGQHVFEPIEIGLGGAEPDLGLVAAAVETRNARGFFKNGAAARGLCRDQLADLALPHHGGRPWAGGSIGKEQLHIARAHILAVDAIGRACLALDATRHFQRIGIIEGGGRSAGGIVEMEGDFGGVAARTAATAGKDHIVHAGRAHVLVGILAHDPAHGLDEIGLAAAVRADDTRQPGLDQELGRFNESLEAGQPELGELQSESLA